jgi:hypothetical protein
MKHMTGVVLVAAGLLLSACGAKSAETGAGSDLGGAGSDLGGAGGSAHPGGAGSAHLGGAGSASVPPPAQGASHYAVQAPSPASAGKSCPVAALDAAIPDLTNSPTETLTALRYLHKVIDGEDAVVFHCKVSGASTYSFEGSMQQAGRSLTIKNGLLSASEKGTADVTVEDAHALPSRLASSQPCVVSAAPASDNNFQIRPGSMWASFECPTLEAAPSTSCKAEGFFVLENCAQ